MLKNIILSQVAAHPSARPQDMIKLCFQAAFGAEHLLIDRDRAYNYFMTEYNATKSTDEPLFEEISDDYARMNIGAIKREGIDPDRAFSMFYMTATEKSEKGEAFEELILSIGKLARDGKLHFSYEEWESTLQEYREKGGGPVHHSDAYRQSEHPSYRVIAKKYIELLKENDNGQDQAF
jgi:hypothetical protein